MSDCNHDVKQKMCQMGKCKPAPGALRREQVEKEFIMQEIERLKREDDPAALRATITQQAQEVERVKGEVARLRSCKGKDERGQSLQPCGHSTYWITDYGTCMACRAEHAEEDLAASQERCLEMAQELAEVKSELSAWKKHGHSKEQQLAAMTTERDAIAKARFGDKYAHPILDACKRRDEAQQQLAAMTTERDELKYRLQVMADTVGEEDFSLRQQRKATA